MADWRDRVRAASRERITSSPTLDVSALLAEARQSDPSITLEELTAARLAASELGSGSPEELAAIIDAELNRAESKGQTLTAHLTAGTGYYGPQGKPRPASTRAHGRRRHLVAARAVLSGDARGISRGARQFFDPRAQDRLWAKYLRGETPGRVHSCRALGTLRAWSYDLPHAKPYRCDPQTGMPPADGVSGSHPLEWVGPIAGIDAYRLMLFRRGHLGDDHDRRYQEARELILRRSGVSIALRDPIVQILALLGLGALASRYL